MLPLQGSTWLGRGAAPVAPLLLIRKSIFPSCCSSLDIVREIASPYKNKNATSEWISTHFQAACRPIGLASMKTNGFYFQVHLALWAY